MGIFKPKPSNRFQMKIGFCFFEANVMSGVRLSRHYLAGMREKHWGRVLFVSSESAVQIPAEMIHYGMTKTAQVAVARGIAETVAGTGITVNSVLAGPTRSEGVETFIAQMGAGGDSKAFEAEFSRSVRPTSPPEAIRNRRKSRQHDRLSGQPARFPRPPAPPSVSTAA